MARRGGEGGDRTARDPNTPAQVLERGGQITERAEPYAKEYARYSAAPALQPGDPEGTWRRVEPPNYYERGDYDPRVPATSAVLDQKIKELQRKLATKTYAGEGRSDTRVLSAEQARFWGGSPRREEDPDFVAATGSAFAPEGQRVARHPGGVREAVDVRSADEALLQKMLERQKLLAARSMAVRDKQPLYVEKRREVIGDPVEGWEPPPTEAKPHGLSLAPRSLPVEHRGHGWAPTRSTQQAVTEAARGRVLTEYPTVTSGTPYAEKYGGDTSSQVIEAAEPLTPPWEYSRPSLHSLSRYQARLTNFLDMREFGPQSDVLFSGAFGGGDPVSRPPPSAAEMTEARDNLKMTEAAIFQLERLSRFVGADDRAITDATSTLPLDKAY